MKPILLALCMVVASSSAWAQPNAAAQAEMQAAVEAANKAAVAGPTEIKLVDQAMLKLPGGLMYIPTAEAGRLLAAMGNRVGDNLLGVVVSPAADANWFVVMRFTNATHSFSGIASARSKWNGVASAFSYSASVSRPRSWLRRMMRFT